MKKISLIRIFSFLCIIATAIACQDKYVTEMVYNLFRPSQSAEPIVEQNSVKYQWYGIEGAVGYNFQLSRHADFSECEIDTCLTNPIVRVFPLSYNTTYYSRVKALAEDSQYDSKWNGLNTVTTGIRILPTVLQEVDEEDLTDKNVTLRWDNTYKITRLVVRGTGTSEFLTEINISESVASEGIVVVSGLEPETSYQATLYDDTQEFVEDRNYNTVIFRTAEPGLEDCRSSAMLIKLTDNIFQVIRDNPDQHNFMLPRGYKYTTQASTKLNHLIIDRKLCIFGARSGEFPLEAGAEDVRPVITLVYFSKAADVQYSSIQIASDKAIDLIRFEGIDFRGGASNRLNILLFSNRAFEVDKLAFKDCFMRDITAGVLLLLGDAKQTINKFSLENCILDHCGISTGYWPIILGNSNLTMGDITLKKSTFLFSKFGIVSSSVPSGQTGAPFAGPLNIFMSNCNTYKMFTTRTASSSKQFFFYFQDTPNVAIKINRSLFTCNGYAGGSQFAKLGTGGTIVSTDSWYTGGDFSILASGGTFESGMNELPGKTAADIFVDPENDDFTIKDESVIANKTGVSASWKDSL